MNVLSPACASKFLNSVLAELNANKDNLQRDVVLHSILVFLTCENSKSKMQSDQGFKQVVSSLEKIMTERQAGYQKEMSKMMGLEEDTQDCLGELWTFYQTSDAFPHSNVYLMLG